MRLTKNYYPKYFKRLIDVLISVGALILLSPIFLVVSALLAYVNHFKIFFIQARPGERERIFKIIKFRTMNDRRDKSGALLPDELRLTPVGRFIRRTSLDEIPQLINVALGDMSLIGPRPLLPRYLPLYTSNQRVRHQVRPGITGWAQVNGRNTITWNRKFELDVWYVRNLSFRLDLKIMFLTIKKIFIQEGITSASSATMEEFKGHDG